MSGCKKDNIFWEMRDREWPNTFEKEITKIQDQYFGHSEVLRGIPGRERHNQGGYVFLSNYTDIE